MTKAKRSGGTRAGSKRAAVGKPRVSPETHNPESAGAKRSTKSAGEKAWDTYVQAIDTVALTSSAMASLAKAVGKTDGDVGEKLELAFTSAREAHNLATAEEGRAFQRYRTVVDNQEDLFKGPAATEPAH